LGCWGCGLACGKGRTKKETQLQCHVVNLVWFEVGY
jgi:hypothetical protein